MADIKKLAWNVDEETYRNEPLLSYSMLSKFNREGFESISTLFDKIESPSLTFGSLVDTLITEPKDLINKFLIASFPKLTDAAEKAIKGIFEEFNEKYYALNKIPDEKLLDKISELRFQSNWKSTTRLNYIKDNCGEYYDLLILSKGKTLVNQADYSAAEECVNALKNSDATREFFGLNFDKKERLYQLKFKGTYKNIGLKCMPDELIIDHENKTIQPVDLKTSGHPEWDFFKSFIQWGYWIQAKLYTYILQQNIDKDGELKNYKILNYKFVVVNKQTKQPLVWDYEDSTKQSDETYGINRVIQCKDWRKIAEELNHYLTSSDNKYPIGINHSKGTSNSITQYLNEQ